MRTARLIAVAAIIGATAGAATVFSLLNRPVAEESVAARTLVAPDPRRLTASTSVAAQQPTEPREVKSPAEAGNSAEQKAPPASAAGAAADPQPSKVATISTPQGPTNAGALAEAPAVNDTFSAQTFNDTVAVAPDPAPAPKPQSKKPRTTSRTASRTYASRYHARGYDRAPRYGYEPRYGNEPRYGARGSFAWEQYY
jgi:hypothetical protein